MSATYDDYDITIYDRRNQFYYNVNLCKPGCTYMINEDKSVSCPCDFSPTISINSISNNDLNINLIFPQANHGLEKCSCYWLLKT